MDLMTSDEYSAYPEAIRSVDGELVVPQRTGRPGRPRLEYRQVPEELVDATVHKVRENHCVTAVEQRLIFGTPEQLAEALAHAAVSQSPLVFPAILLCSTCRTSYRRFSTAI